MIRKRSANVRGLATFCTMGILYAKYCQGFHIDHHRISIANAPIRDKFHSSTEYGNSLILNKFGQYNKDSKKLFPLRFSKSHTSSRQHKMAFNMSSSAVHGDNDGNSKSSFGIYKNPYVQVALCGVLYLFHLLVLTQHEIVFPFQLFPDNNGKFQSIGLDSVAGMVSFATMIYLSRQNKDEKNNLSLDNGVPSPFSTPSKEELPWSLKKKTGGREAIAGTLLLIVYFLTGFLSELIDECLYIANERGIGMSIAMHRSLQVLFGHLSWVLIGSTIIRKNVGPFFTKKNKWYKNKWNTFWLGWVMGGYFVSAWIFNLSDLINQMILPMKVFEAAGDGVVAQLINPENNDLMASAVGYIAPCLSAPWWEEILYRGFMLPALTRVLPIWMSVLVSGFIFSIHHVSTIGFIPLWSLGALWAALYMKCKNLFVTILIHALWNSRIFIGGWFGL